jgi:16S rRNA (guanine527-N7)-methyltransferase
MDIGLAIGEKKAEQFMRYLAHIIEWNKTINLTAITDPKEIIIKHFIDSLAALVATSFPEQAVVLDVGSGGGFPGIPLKIVRSDLQMVLVEPVQKKCSFLNSIIGLLQLRGISAFNGTIEQYAKRPVHHVVDMIALRALKFKEIRKHIAPLLAPSGKVVLYRTEAVQNHEVDDDFYLVSEKTLILPQGAGKRVISVIEKSNS